MNAGKLLFHALLAAVLAGTGVAGGWLARSQNVRPSPAGGAQSAAEGEKGPLFSEAALKNMGVFFEESQVSDFCIVREVPARIAVMPSSVRPVVARWGGSVSSILPGSEGAEDPDGPEEYEGAVVLPGDVVVEMIRAPVPVMDRKLTGDVIQAISEPVHEAAAGLRSAKKALEIATMEWERVKAILAGGGELPVVPRQAEINLRYEVLKAEAEFERIRASLYLHGLTAEQIDAAANGAVAPPGPVLWRRALERNGLWPESGADLLGKLPEESRNNPWTFAALGELNALGLCDPHLLQALEEVEGLGARFHEVASLLMQGHSLDDAVDIFKAGALDPVAKVRVPAGAPDFDVRKVLVRPGEKVEPGAVLALLADSRKVLLVLEAAGADLAVVQAAAEACEEFSARPMVESGAPGLEGIVIASFLEQDGADPAPKAFALVENTPVSTGSPEDRLSRRIWKLRPGMRYMARIPVGKLAERHVLPRDAVVSEGAERVIFLRRGEEFLKKPVHVEYENSEVAVLAEGTFVAASDQVAVSGALALSLALKSRGEVRQDESGEHKHGPT